MHGFESTLSRLVDRASPESIHEIGCGEGYWVLRWLEHGFTARGCDFSTQAIGLARENAIARGISSDLFAIRSIYNLDAADLIVCCEVLEHLENPDAALEALHRVARRYLIISVPREPLWRMLNFARGQYLTKFGNTPGHIQHWSARTFINLVSRYFEVIEVTNPLPWTMLLCRPRR